MSWRWYGALLLIMIALGALESVVFPYLPAGTVSPRPSVGLILGLVAGVILSTVDRKDLVQYRPLGITIALAAPLSWGLVAYASSAKPFVTCLVSGGVDALFGFAMFGIAYLLARHTTLLSKK